MLTIGLVWNANLLQHHKFRTIYIFIAFPFLKNRHVCFDSMPFDTIVCYTWFVLWLSICFLFAHILLMFSAFSFQYGPFAKCINILVCFVMHKKVFVFLCKKKQQQQPWMPWDSSKWRWRQFPLFFRLLFSFFSSFLFRKIHDPHDNIYIFSVRCPLWFRCDTCWLFINNFFSVVLIYFWFRWNVWPCISKLFF